MATSAVATCPFCEKDFPRDEETFLAHLEECFGWCTTEESSDESSEEETDEKNKTERQLVTECLQGNLQKCLTIQDKTMKNRHPMFGADPFGTVVRSWQMQSKMDDQKQKHFSRWYYKTVPAFHVDRKTMYSAIPKPESVQCVRICPRLGEYELPISALMKGEAYDSPIFDNNTQFMVDGQLDLVFALSPQKVTQHIPRSIRAFHGRNRNVRDWTQSEDKQTHKFIICQHLKAEKRSVGDVVCSRALELPCAAKLSTMLLADGHILVIPQTPNAFDSKMPLTIAMVQIDDLVGEESKQIDISLNKLPLKVMSVGEGVTGPPPGWAFTAQRDYYEDGLLQGNEHAWVKWQNGRVLVGMMHNKETGEMGVAFITVNWNFMITKFKLVPLCRVSIPWLFESDYAVRLVGHSRRSLIFRNGPAKFIAVRMLYQRMDKVPKTIQKDLCEVIDLTDQVTRFGCKYSLQKVAMPHVSRVHVLPGGMLLLRLRYPEKQVEFLTRVPLPDIAKRLIGDY